ncbi:diphthine synthase [Candidatus Micrarchaeota archaeon]|nr:diphthine synthase [Candidatus Micrarchaeota archaeon]
MLILIGTGISFDLTLSAIDELKKCDEIYIESYTNLIENENISTLEKLINKKIISLERSQVESKFLIEQAKNSNVALLVSGDPLIATTHISLIIDAEKARIETKIIHNSSIYSAAAGKAGLQIYKFGKTASIPNPRPNYNPTSWFEIIKENLAREAHTLVLLDTEPKPMDAKTALELIERTNKDTILKNKKIIILSRIGENNEKIIYNEIEKLKITPLGKPPFVIIIPGKLHMVEEEYLQQL